MSTTLAATEELALVISTIQGITLVIVENGILGKIVKVSVFLSTNFCFSFLVRGMGEMC